MTRRDMQRQIERSRDVIQTRREEHQAALTERKRYMATTRKTAVGDRVPRWVDPEPVYELIEKVGRAMRAVYAEARDRRDADVSMAQQAHPSADRFPALRQGGQ